MDEIDKIQEHQGKGNPQKLLITSICNFIEAMEYTKTALVTLGLGSVGVREPGIYGERYQLTGEVPMSLRPTI